MELQNLTVNTRETQGKGPARQMRAKGNVPAVVYGGGKDPVQVSINIKDLERVLHGRMGEHAVVQLDVSGNPELNSPALLKAVQHHPIEGYVLHADFMRIRLDERIETVVPIVLTGQPQGVVLGGVLEHTLRSIEVECLALEVPSEFAVDVLALGIGESIHVGSIQAPEGVRILTDPDRVIASIHVPRALASETAQAAEGEEAGEAKEGAAEGEAKKEG